MKTLQRYKKVIRNTLLEIITASFFVVSSIFSVSAANGQLTGYEYVMYYYSNNIQGTASGYREPTADYYIYNDPSVAKYRGIVEVNFEGPVNGYFCLGLPTTFGSSDVVVVENCVIDHTNNGGIWYFNVNGVDHCTVEYYVQTPSRGLSYLSGEWTAATDLDDINTTLGQIEGYVDGVETSLNNIYTRLGTINTSISLTNTILNKISNIVKIGTFPIWQQNILMWANNYSTLNFDSNLPYFSYDSSTNNSTYTAANRLCVQPKSTFSLIFYSSVNINTSDINLYYPTSYTVSISRSYAFTPPGTMFLYRYDFTNSDNALHYFEIEINKNANIYPLFWGNINLIPNDIHLLYGDDFNDTYTRLLQQMINAIGTISQTQIVENNTNINNYNSYQQQINNVENNYYQQFNNFETNIENNNTFDFTGLSTDGVQVYNNLFSNVYGISLVKWPVLITLLGLVIVIILG